MDDMRSEELKRKICGLLVRGGPVAAGNSSMVV